MAPLAERVYPVLVVDPDGEAEGILLTGLDDAAWAVLDAYEEDLYDLVHISLADGGHAWTYAAPEGADAADGVWSAPRFEAEHLSAYAAECRVWRAEFAAAGAAAAGSAVTP